MGYYIKLSNIYYNIAYWLYYIFYNALYLTITASFYFLADFGFEARINQAQKTDENQGLNAKINVTEQSNSTKVSLSAESTLEIC